MATSVFDITCKESAFVLAVTVIQDRVKNMSKEDRDDLFALIPYLCGDDEEEKQSAIIAANEILDQSNGKVLPLPTPKQSIDMWVKFVSKKIRDAREDAGITQGELAEKTGLQQSHISRLEKGEHSPTEKTLKKIANALEIELSCFEPSAS